MIITKVAVLLPFILENIQPAVKRNQKLALTNAIMTVHFRMHLVHKKSE
jgi:hypothetical protein